MKRKSFPYQKSGTIKKDVTFDANVSKPLKAKQWSNILI